MSLLNKLSGLFIYIVITVIIGGFFLIYLGYGNELGSYAASVLGGIVVAFVMLFYQENVLKEIRKSRK